MKQYLSAIALLILPLYAIAGNDRNNPPSSVGGNTSSLSAAAASSISGASGGNASAVSGGSSANSNFVYDGDRNPVNSAFGYAPPPTADCQAVFGGGAQGVNIGLSISGSYDDSECNKRAWAAWLMSVKREEAAIKVACTSKYLKDNDALCTKKVDK